jgi:hypothetical protein
MKIVYIPRKPSEVLPDTSGEILHRRGNMYFSFREYFLIQIEAETGLLKWSRYVGHVAKLMIPREAKKLDHYCFRDKLIVEIVFEEGSELVAILGACFIGAHLERIHIPDKCELLGASAFSTRLTLDPGFIAVCPLKKITFPPYSRLRIIAHRCFIGA